MISRVFAALKARFELLAFKASQRRARRRSGQDDQDCYPLW
jgi:hypothetical protein